jgi:GAF domain-containing protein
VPRSHGPGRSRRRAQRNAELALINSVQEALAGELDLQAIYDLVGDRLRDVFDAQVVDIGVYDELDASSLPVHDRARRFVSRTSPSSSSASASHAMETREPLMLAEVTNEILEHYGNPLVLSGEPSKSSVYVPLVVSGRGDRRHLTPRTSTGRTRSRMPTNACSRPIARSLSVALENARLVHETRKRNAELALLNSVQQSITGELDLQAIYDFVGDKLQEIFDAQVVDIGVFDREPGSRIPLHASSGASVSPTSRAHR